MYKLVFINIEILFIGSCYPVGRKQKSQIRKKNSCKTYLIQHLHNKKKFLQLDNKTRGQNY